MDLSNYKIKDAIAVGAESVLYKAEDKDGNEFCVKAIRRFLRHHHGHVPMREQENPYPYRRKKRHLVNEFHVAQSLRGPDQIEKEENTGIVDIFQLHERKIGGWEWGSDLLMELLPGDDLGDHRFVRALSARDKLNFLHQAAKAILYLHNRGFIHLDIKPANFVVSKGIVKIIDFGTTASKGEIPGRLVGTPGYLPPEQIVAEEHATETNDVFSFGVTANEVMGGRNLQQDVLSQSKRARKTDAVYAAQSDESPLDTRGASTNGTPSELITLLHHCTIPNKSRRYSSMVPVVRQLERIIDRYK